MARLNKQQLAQLWIQAGGNPNAAGTAAAIALAESGGRTDALNPRAPDYSVGPWQINYYGNLRGPRTRQFGTPQRLMSDPLANARAAVAISGGGRNFSPWTTYTSGAYKKSGGGASVGQLQSMPSMSVGQTNGQPGRYSRFAQSVISAFADDTPSPTAMLGAIMQLRRDQSGGVGAPTAGPAFTGGIGAAGQPAAGKIIGTPGKGTHTLGNWESDNAVDVAMPYGTPIRAVADGVIGNQFGSLGSGGRFAGLRAHLVTNDNEYYYAHMSRFAQGVRPGARVKAGQVIGYSGSANGVNHLHFGERGGNPMSLYR